MNIQLLTPKIIPLSQKRDKSHYSSTVMPSNLKGLKADTVSFSGKMPKSQSVFEEAIEQCYISSELHFANVAKKFHITLKNVCEKLKDLGFSYDELYNQKHPVKSLESFVDKYSRQGYVQDTVRGTVYWPEQHNIEVFKKFLDAMKEEGYEIAPIKVKLSPDSSTLKKVPDLEIRQNGVAPEDLEILGEFLKMAEISKPRSSSYADYQMRFVPISSGGKTFNKLPLELIMLYGPHYAKAKELESKYVFNITRAFDKLHVKLNKKYSEKSPGRRIVNNIDVIKTRLREDVSRPLFTNAYNADLKVRGEAKLPVVISKAHSAMLDGYMSGIRQKLPLYYKERRKELKTDEAIIEIIKNSSEYKQRTDKNISPEEIKRLRQHLLDILPRYEAEDVGVVATAQALLKETIKKFGEK